MTIWRPLRTARPSVAGDAGASLCHCLVADLLPKERTYDEVKLDLRHSVTILNLNAQTTIPIPEGGCTFCAPRASPPPSLPRQQAERCPSAVDLVG